MTSGIYKLVFESGKIYVGRSVNIEQRYEDHLTLLKAGKGSDKLREEYNVSGVPILHIIMKVHPDHLDVVEAYWISNLLPELNTNYPKCSFDQVMTQTHMKLFQLSTAEMVNALMDNYNKIHKHEEALAQLGKELEQLQSELHINKVDSNILNDLLTRVQKAEATAEVYKLAYDTYVKLPWYKKILNGRDL